MPRTQGLKPEGHVTQPVLIATKLHPPDVREQTIPRAELAERLNVGPGQRLTLVACPAGFGKTTLAAAWRESEAARKPIAWLTLDEGDKDPAVLWSYVIEALCRVRPSLGEAISPEITSAAPITEVVLPRLVNELVAQGEIALVLDDFHRLSAGPACDSVAWFIEHVPSTVQLVILTRTEPPLRLPALRARGELLELRADDLRFTQSDAREFLNGHLSLDLSVEDIDSLVARTEGWPAGIYLAALSLGKAAQADRSARVGSFGASSRHVVDYLTAEVLEAHDSPTQSLIIRTSILERLCGPLCDAVMETKGSAAMLDALSRSNLFLLQLDDESDWYRFHHLFAQLLRVELQRRDPDLIPALHRRAYEWHRKHGSTEEAMRHAMAAGAFQEAADLVATVYARYGNAGRYLTVLNWLEAFPEEVFRDDPRLRLAEGWVLAVSGRPDDAAAAVAIDLSAPVVDHGPLPDGFPSFEASLMTLEAIFLAPTRGDVGSQLEVARRAAELVPPGTVWRSAVCWAVGWGLYFRGRFDEADRWFEESVVEGHAAKQWIPADSSLAYRSFIAGVLGRVSDQHELAEQAGRALREHRLEGVDGVVLLALGLSLAARGRETEGPAVVEQGVERIRGIGQPLHLAHALLHQADLLRALGQNENATAVAGEARSIISGCKDPGMLRDRLRSFGLSPSVRSMRRDGELTDRELTVLRLLGGSLSERDIARDLYLSHNTVHSHTRTIYRKLAVSSRADAVARARELGLL